MPSKSLGSCTDKFGEWPLRTIEAEAQQYSKTNYDTVESIKEPFLGLSSSSSFSAWVSSRSCAGLRIFFFGSRRNLLSAGTSLSVERHNIVERRLRHLQQGETESKYDLQLFKYLTR